MKRPHVGDLVRVIRSGGLAEDPSHEIVEPFIGHLGRVIAVHDHDCGASWEDPRFIVAFDSFQQECWFWGEELDPVASPEVCVVLPIRGCGLTDCHAVVPLAWEEPRQ